MTDFFIGKQKRTMPSVLVDFSATIQVDFAAKIQCETGESRRDSPTLSNTIKPSRRWRRKLDASQFQNEWKKKKIQDRENPSTLGETRLKNKFGNAAPGTELNFDKKKRFFDDCIQKDEKKLGKRRVESIEDEVNKCFKINLATQRQVPIWFR